MLARAAPLPPPPPTANSSRPSFPMLAASTPPAPCYAEQALKRHGALKGGWLARRRLAAVTR